MYHWSFTEVIKYAWKQAHLVPFCVKVQLKVETEKVSKVSSQSDVGQMNGTVTRFQD